MRDPAILIIDDDPNNLAIMADYLGDRNLKILLAENGASGLSRASHDLPDVILLDIVMPGMDGYETCRRLKATESTKDIPVIFMTGLADIEHKIKAFEAGAVDYITKPFQREEVLARVGVHLRIRELTRRLQEERDLLNKMNKALELSNQALDEFASIASHDLQEPLRKIVVFGDHLMAKFSGALGEQGIQYLQRMHRAAKRMQDLIRALLNYSRVATKADPFTLFSLKGLVEEILADLEVLISETGGVIEIGDLPMIHADIHQMRQLFQNLIGNALKYHHPERRPIIRIRSIPYDNAFLRIVVEDNGIGFDEKYLDRIFAPFHRLHGRSKYEGTGMGLAICKKIAEHYNGTITAESTPGKGSTFIVTLPKSLTP